MCDPAGLWPQADEPHQLGPNYTHGVDRTCGAPLCAHFRCTRCEACDDCAIALGEACASLANPEPPPPPVVPDANGTLDEQRAYWLHLFALDDEIPFGRMMPPMP